MNAGKKKLSKTCSEKIFTNRWSESVSALQAFLQRAFAKHWSNLLTIDGSSSWIVCYKQVPTVSHAAASYDSCVFCLLLCKLYLSIKRYLCLTRCATQYCVNRNYSCYYRNHCHHYRNLTRFVENVINPLASYKCNTE